MEAAIDIDTTDATGDLILSGAQELVIVGDSEGAASDVKFYSGSVTLVGNDANTVNVSNTLQDAEGDFGSWTVSTGTGNDTITGSEAPMTLTPQRVPTRSLPAMAMTTLLPAVVRTLFSAALVMTPLRLERVRIQ